MHTFRLWVQFHNGFWHFLTKNVNIIMNCLTMAAHSSYKNWDFQALGSISPWLFATFWPKMSIWSWGFWWWMPTGPIKMHTFRLWVQSHHVLFGFFWPEMPILSLGFWWWMPTGPIKMHTFRLWVQFPNGFMSLFDQKCQYYHGVFDGGCPMGP